MNDGISIRQGFPDEQRETAAGLYDAAFGAKLSIAIPDPVSRIAILKKGFNPVFCFVAVKCGELIGIAGFKTAEGSLTGGISFRILKEELGFFRAIRAILILLLFERKKVPGQLLMDGISVSPDMRGAGIGSRLLNSIVGYAKKEGYQTIRLDVIDTNPAARRLYERFGFTPVRTERFAYLKWLLGFESATEMEYKTDSQT